jgi:hypothetical protein
MQVKEANQNDEKIEQLNQNIIHQSSHKIKLNE